MDFFPVARPLGVRNMNHDELEQSMNSLHELYARACELSPFFQQGNLLQAALTPEEGYKEISKLAKSLFPTDAGALYLYSTEPADNGLNAVASWTDFPGMQDSFLRHDCWALRRGKVHWVDADCDATFCKHVPDSSCSSY